MASRIRGERDIIERIATLEAHFDQLLEDGLRREEKQDKLLNKLDSLEDKFDAAQNELSRYKGYVGGILWMLAAMGAALVFILKWAQPFWNFVKLKVGGP